MAFLKFAKATLQKPGIQFAEWDALRRKAILPEPEFQKRTAKVILQEYDPSQYMLSHATIVASVDVDNSSAPVGRHFVDGFEVNRPFQDYYVTPNTQRFINNNNDGFERKLLMASFKTFVGAQSYIEHVQIPELSQGRIIDAAARDIGDSVYVDILIANDLKHAALIRSIKSGQLGTLSMGCFTPGAQVSMADGTRVPIEKVAVGDLVLSHKGRVCEVTNKQIRIGRFRLQKIDVAGVPSAITATRNHPFFVLRNESSCACGCGELLAPDTVVDIHRRISRKFRPGHQLRVYNPSAAYPGEEANDRRAKLDAIMARPPELVEVRADELKVGDLLCFPRTHDVCDGGKASVEQARLLGYFLAEGSFLKRDGRRVEVQFNFSMRERHTFVAEVVALLKSRFPEANDPWVQERPERDTCVVHITGEAVARWFYANGGEYSHKKRLAPEVMTWPMECHRHLLGAWLNGDGTQEKNSLRTSGTTTSYALACQLHQLFARCGVYATMYCNHDRRSSEVAVAVNGGLSIRGESSGKLTSFTLGISRSLGLEGACQKLSTGAKGNTKWRVSDDHVYFPVRGIEQLDYEGPVHDMEVEGDHSYLVEGVAVHNCSTSSTTCTKCGNVAKDETQLCACIRYFKGQEFVDEYGGSRKVAELCGHYTDPTSVRFIEASWVANPAFKGAVLRSVLSAEDVAHVESKLHLAFLKTGLESIQGGIAKAARSPFAQGQQAPAEEPAADPAGDQGVPPGAPAAPPAEDPIDKAVKDLSTALREKAIEHVRQEISQGEVDAVRDVVDNNKQNESLIRSALVHPQWRRIARFVVRLVGARDAKRVLHGLLLHKSGGWRRVKQGGLSGREILAVSRVLDVLTKKSSMAGETRVYRAVLSVGGTAPYADDETYLAACRQVFGRVVTGSEASRLLEKGRLYALGRS